MRTEQKNFIKEIAKIEQCGLYMLVILSFCEIFTVMGSFYYEKYIYAGIFIFVLVLNIIAILGHNTHLGDPKHSF